MDQSLLTKRISAGMTGIQPIAQKPQAVTKAPLENQQSFKNILEQKLFASSDLTFSKHAVNRVIERNVEISQSSIERLNEGVKLAREKGLNDTLILVDATAYIVNAKNGTVITTVNNDDIKGNVFTNIEGTVIM